MRTFKLLCAALSRKRAEHCCTNRGYGRAAAQKLPHTKAFAHAHDADEHPSKVAGGEYFGTEHFRHSIT